ncbi:hypothetical protein DFH08DRAFT_818393 [Mycena albidolilacea]|uniref:Uncharacterized protein n=1 Tax=Mycena albidolilacea TaxID=1033008 RepID=A0AAD7EG01_9AGAR|nr:hypothetical protein DFH08DRAFT_818393 [Mycena albidolilacea]
MTAAAICMRCGVFACVYPPLFFPQDTTTTLMPQQPRIKISRARASWTVTLGECGGLEEQNKVCEARTTVSLGVRYRDCHLRLHASARNHHTGVRFDREARYRRNGCSLVLRAENRMQNVAEADSCKMQFFPITGSFMHLLPSNTAAEDFFDPRMTEWVKDDGGCNDAEVITQNAEFDVLPLRLWLTLWTSTNEQLVEEVTQVLL